MWQEKPNQKEFIKIYKERIENIYRLELNSLKE